MNHHQKVLRTVNQSTINTSLRATLRSANRVCQSKITGVTG